MDRFEVVVLASLLCAVPAAHADEPVQRWQLGAGVESNLAEPLIAAGPLYTGFGVASAQVEAERRVGSADWLRLGLQGGFASQRAAGDSQGLGLPATRSNQATAGVALGLRHTLNPGATVEVSPYADVRLSWLRTELEAPPATSNFRTEGAHLAAGVAADHLLLPQLGVRVALQLLDAGYDRVSTSFGPVPSTGLLVPSGSSLTAQAVARPSLLLFLRF